MARQPLHDIHAVGEQRTGTFMQTSLTIYAEDAVASASLALVDPRLADLLVSPRPIVTTGADVRALADGRRLLLPVLDLARDEILLAAPDGLRGDPSRRLATQAHPAVVRIGPYLVHGRLHAPASTDAFSAARHRAWIAITDADVTWSQGGRVRTVAHPVLLVNARRVAALKPDGDQMRDMRGAMVASSWVTAGH